MDPQREYLAKVIKDELFCVNVGYKRLDKEKSYLQQIHTAKSADTLEEASLYKLRKKIGALPEPYREQVRHTYLRSKDVRQREFQQRQFEMLAILEKMIRKKTASLGLDYRHFSIGGYDQGLYERMFRTEPAKYMSKAQFLIVMRRVFGFDMSNKTEVQLSNLFTAFDIDEEDKVDWRAFLYLLALIIHADEPVRGHLRLAYSIFASSGSLDMECRDKLKLSTIKDIIQVPVVLSSRSTIRSIVDDCWFELVQTDFEAIQMVHARNAPSDYDDMMLSFRLFDKLISGTKFKDNLEAATVFGRRDKRIHTYVLEDNYYHPTILKIIATLRREIRCDNEADLFLSRKRLRILGGSLNVWRRYCGRRMLARGVIVKMFVHWCHARQAYFFDYWRRTVIQEMQSQVIQRYGRGCIGRARRRLMIQVNKKALQIQSVGRTMKSRIKYKKETMHIDWAAVMIQKTFRGLMARRLVQKKVEAAYDTGMRQLAKQRHLFEMQRSLRAATRIQNYMRRFVRKMKAYNKLKKKLDQELLEREMVQHKAENLRKQRIYRQELEDWFKKRKEEHDRDRLHENQTAIQKGKIIAYRRRIDMYEKERKEQLRLEKNEKAEEAFIEQWLHSWELKKVERQKARMAECKHSLLNPETPYQKELKKELQKRIKNHIKVVLRKADKMRIPMEIPEAKEIATDEVIEMEGKEEIKRVEQEMHDAAVAAEKAKEEKRLMEEEQEARRKERMKEWAATKIQGCVRCMIARRVLRQRAYKRYEKRFDANLKAYYYVDTRKNTTSWDKPQSLGSYDIDAKNHWVPLTDAEGDTYYYNPHTWKMQWKKPPQTVFCDICGPKAFAIARLENDKKFYCEEHLNEKAAELQEQNVSTKEIKFKSFDGSVEGSSRINITVVPVETWFVHVIQATDRLVRRASMLDDDNLEYSDDDESSMRVDGEIPMCSRCDVERAEVHCVNCEVPFCRKCFDRKHKNALWSTHTYREYESHFIIDEEDSSLVASLDQSLAEEVESEDDEYGGLV